MGMGGVMTLHPDIERLALLGWHMVPTVRKSRKGFWRGYYDDATHDLDMLERWQHEYPGCNWAVLPGPSGVWALDVDVPGPDHAEDGVASLRALVDLHGPLPPRPHGRSGGGGHLLVFRATAPIKGGSGKPAPGLDTQANRSNTFTVSPSRHRRTGLPYRWIVAPWELAPPPAPEWLLALLAPPPPPPAPRRPIAPTNDRAIRALMRSFREVEAAPRGQRNAALHRRAVLIGGFIGAGALDRGTAERELIAAGLAAGQSRAEAQSTVRSGLRAGELRPIAWGNA